MPPAQPETSLPLTAAQSGVWAAQQLDPASPRYNCGSFLEIRGSIDVERMRSAVSAALADAEALRVRFLPQTDSGVPRQLLAPVPDDPLDVLDLSAADRPREAAERWMRADMSRPADLISGRFVRHALLKEAPDRWLLYLRYHHIVMDGLGQTAHLRRVAELYRALAEGAAPPPSRALPLADLVAADAAYTTSPAHDRDRAYWLRRFADRPDPVSLSDRQASSARGLRRRAITLSDADTALLRGAAERLGSRPSALLIAAVAAYQCRITGRRETVLSLPLPARPSAAALATPFMAANELPLRCTADHDTSFAALVAEVSAELGHMLRHQCYRGEELYRDLSPEGPRRRLAGTTVNVVTFDAETPFGDLPSTAHHLSSGPVEDLQFDFYADARCSRVRLVADANPERYTAGSPAAHATRLLALLRSAVAEPDRLVGLLQIMDDDERRAVLDVSAPAARPYDLTVPLHDLVVRQAERTPDAVAVEVAAGSLTYRRLVDGARRLAGHLRERGVAPGDVVGVHQERSLDLVVSLLAVLMSGAAYLPLDPELPLARLRFQIEDAAVGTVLSTSHLVGRLAGAAPGTVLVDRVLPGLPETAEPPPDVGPADIAYVIYTSGSTGTPKGVAIPHRGVVNRLLWMQQEYRLGAGECVLQKTPFTFDVSVWEFFWPLIAGARLHVAEPGAHRDPRSLAQAIRRHGVTTVHFVPPMLDLFLAEPLAAGAPTLRRVMCSGEALRPETIARFFAVYGDGPGAPELFNLYGPTEASIDVTHWHCTEQDARGPVPIGRAVANTGLYVLDAAGGPLPFGTPGELYIGGVQVAAGYLGRPELTEERFVPNPYGDGVLYRTGDVAVLREDGVLEYRGRLDQQVKVRGFRIEPGEVESALLALDGVDGAVVTAVRRPDGQQRLRAHVVAPGRDASALAAALRDRLPEYMVPSHIVPLDALPLLPNGKVDRRSLPDPAPAGPEPAHDDAAAGTPRTEAERLVRDAFAETLQARTVGLDESFFALGGDSIHSIRIRAALERRGLTFTLAEIYEAPTVRALARRTRPYRPTGPRTAPFSLVSPTDRAALPGDLTDAYPLTSMQAGMLFHAQYEAGSSVYRVVTSVRVALPFDEERLRAALLDTMLRHPALHSGFHLTGYSEPLQLVHREVAVPLVVDRGLFGADPETRERALAAWADRAKHRDFDLTRPPLLAFTAHPLAEDTFQLGVVEHHVVLDGWSDALMLAEIAERYAAATRGESLWLPEIPTTFREFVAAERKAIADEEHRRFWAEELAGAEHRPLPLRTTGRPTGHRHVRYDVPLDERIGARVGAAARAAGLPVKALLVAVHAVVLHTVTPGAEVLTGVVSHGRLDDDGGDQVIGVFLNTLPLRLRVAAASWPELARAVHDHERRTAPHRRYPYARILRDHEDLPLDSYVNIMDFHQTWGDGETLRGGFGIAETNYPLAVNFLIEPDGGRLGLWLDCDTALLEPEFCERLAGYYGRALAALAADPAGAPPAELRGEAELALLREWNDTAAAVDAAATVTSLIGRQAAATPDAVALIDDRDRLSYAELDTRAGRLAERLRAHGAGPGGRVGVSVRRSVDLVVAMVAVGRSGAAYVPIDPEFPAERLRYIVEDAGLGLIITGPGGTAPVASATVLRMDRDSGPDAAADAGPSSRPVPRPAGPDDPVYVIYTSGSTGQPKGTVLRHRNVVNFFAGMNRYFPLGGGDTVLALTSVSFDISVLELLWPLTRGATVVVAGERMIERLTPADGAHSLAALVERHGVTLAQATPSFMAAVTARPEALDALRPLRALLVGGEAFPSGLARRLLTALPSVRLYNMYGPTETTIWSTVYELEPERDLEAAVLPIGRPIANTVLRVATGEGRETPIGVAGELWIGGDGVAAGYLGRPELTAERFVELPGAPGEGRYYRTGDRVRWRSDGVLEFLGRIDRQVKILGHRIEPDEVESVLSRHEEVASVAVIAAPRAGRVELVAYVAPVASGADRDGETGHIDRWREVWESAYTADPQPPEAEAEAEAETEPGARDFAGWTSSYTKKPIPVHEMREWLGHTVARVRALGARRVVDVGVGVGLFLRELGRDADSYLGIDLSPAALAAAAAAVSPDGVPPRWLTLRQGEAGLLAELPSASADVVLLNSVVQYFPGPDHLRRVLAEAVRVAGPSGAVFVGDVRDLTLLQAFHADTQVRRAHALTEVSEVADAAARALADERELCLTTAFFAEFAASAGVGLRIELKRGRHANELTRFRWDVTLLGSDRTAAEPPGGKQQDWQEIGGAGPKAIRAIADSVAGTDPDATFRITDLPDRRLVRPLAAQALLRETHAEGTTAWDLERAMWEADDADAVDPEEVALLGERLGRPVRLSPAASGHAGRFDVVFAARATEPREQ